MDRLIFASVAFVALPVFAADVTSGDIEIRDAFALETTRTARTGAGYMTISNAGDAPDRLLAVIADFPRVMLHETVESDGVARMDHLSGGIVIQPGETIVFAPGGRHVMFMGLDGDPFEVGEEIPATLVFERAGHVEITFDVEALSEHADGS